MVPGVEEKNIQKSHSYRGHREDRQNTKSKYIHEQDIPYLFPFLTLPLMVHQF